MKKTIVKYSIPAPLVQPSSNPRKIQHSSNPRKIQHASNHSKIQHSSNPSKIQHSSNTPPDPSPRARGYPPHPDHPHFRHKVRESAPFAGGWARGLDHPPPSPVSFFAVFATKAHTDTISTYKLSSPARGGGGLPLPAAAAAAPFKGSWQTE